MANITGNGTPTTGVGSTITAGQTGAGTVGVLAGRTEPDGSGGYGPGTTLIPARI